MSNGCCDARVKKIGIPVFINNEWIFAFLQGKYTYSALPVSIVAKATPTEATIIAAGLQNR